MIWSEYIQAVNGDSTKLMKLYPNNYFDLAVVDPPYGIKVNHSMGRRKGMKSSNFKKVKWDDSPPNAEYFKQLFRVSKNQIIWGGNYMTDFLPPSPCWLLWDKKFSEDVSFAQFEMAWTSFNTSAKKFDKHPSQSYKIHPTQKPIELYNWIYDRYAKPGDLILDTHLGSGTNAVSAHHNKLIFIGFEIMEKHYKQSHKFFVNNISRLKFF